MSETEQVPYNFKETARKVEQLGRGVAALVHEMRVPRWNLKSAFEAVHREAEGDVKLMADLTLVTLEFNGRKEKVEEVWKEVGGEASPVLETEKAQQLFIDLTGTQPVKPVQWEKGGLSLHAVVTTAEDGAALEKANMRDAGYDFDLGNRFGSEQLGGALYWLGKSRWGDNARMVTYELNKAGRKSYIKRHEQIHLEQSIWMAQGLFGASRKPSEGLVKASYSQQYEPVEGLGAHIAALQEREIRIGWGEFDAEIKEELLALLGDGGHADDGELMRSMYGNSCLVSRFDVLKELTWNKGLTAHRGNWPEFGKVMRNRQKMDEVTESIHQNKDFRAEKALKVWREMERALGSHELTLGYLMPHPLERWGGVQRLVTQYGSLAGK